MSSWTCLARGRDFRRTNQGHTCDPLMSPEDRLASLTPMQREICEAILARLPEVGDVHVEPVRVGFFLKHGVLRCRARGAALPPPDDPRSRKMSQIGELYYAGKFESALEQIRDL